MSSVAHLNVEDAGGHVGDVCRNDGVHPQVGQRSANDTAGHDQVLESFLLRCLVRCSRKSP